MEDIIETDLSTITDIIQLKAYKADQYDILESANRQIRLAEMNIQAINTRITQLQSQQEREKRDISASVNYAGSPISDL